MKKKQPQRAWVYQPQAPKFAASEKTKLLERIKTTITELPKLSEKVSRLDMRANRIYLYELIEPFKPEGAVFLKPLIDDKYLEVPYARITLNDTIGDSCSVDCQRHNNQWMTLYTGTLIECLHAIEGDDAWF